MTNAFAATSAAVRLHHMKRSSGHLTTEQAAIVQRNLQAFRREFGEAIGRDFSAEEAAEAAGMPIDTLRSYERGYRRPKLASMVRLADLYERPIEDFVAELPPPRPVRWRPRARIAFKAWALDADLEARAMAAIQELTAEQMNRAMAAKLTGRRGKKL